MPIIEQFKLVASGFVTVGLWIALTYAVIYSLTAVFFLVQLYMELVP